MTVTATRVSADEYLTGDYPTGSRWSDAGARGLMPAIDELSAQ